MTCEQVRDLTGAYVLGALTGDEERQVREHVAECALHGEIASMRAAALGVAASAPPLDPPPGLGGRISEAVRAETGTVTITPYVQLRTRRTARWAAWSVAAALVAALGALVVWNVSLQGGDSEPELVHVFRAEGGDWVRVETTLGRGAGTTVSLGGLDPLPSERSYQLWAVRDGSAISLGVFGTNAEGRWSGEVSVALERGDEIAVTEEAAGGSDAPTSDPLLSTRL